jgi:hypothetical protein
MAWIWVVSENPSLFWKSRRSGSKSLDALAMPAVSVSARTERKPESIALSGFSGVFDRRDHIAAGIAARSSSVAPGGNAGPILFLMST